jgi:hypothetical protein
LKSWEAEFFFAVVYDIIERCCAAVDNTPCHWVACRVLHYRQLARWRKFATYKEEVKDPINGKQVSVFTAGMIHDRT